MSSISASEFPTFVFVWVNLKHEHVRVHWTKLILIPADITCIPVLQWKYVRFKIFNVLFLRVSLHLNLNLINENIKTLHIISSFTEYSHYHPWCYSLLQAFGRPNYTLPFLSDIPHYSTRLNVQLSFFLRFLLRLLSHAWFWRYECRDHVMVVMIS